MQISLRLCFEKAFLNLKCSHPMDCTCDGVDHCAEDGGGLDELFEDVGLCGQREAVIQHLLQEFIHHDHVVLNRSLCTHSKIILRTKKSILEYNYYWV